MKKIVILFLLALTISACGGKKKQTTTESEASFHFDNSKPTVLYFHSNHRCATCLAVENTTKEALATSFDGAIPFYSLDINETQNKKLIKEYSIGGQTLLVIKGDQKTNLTNVAFMYARSNPEKVKAELISSIKSLQ